MDLSIRKGWLEDMKKLVDKFLKVNPNNFLIMNKDDEDAVSKIMNLKLIVTCFNWDDYIGQIY